MDELVRLSDMHDSVDEFKSLSLELASATADLDVTMESEEGIYGIIDKNDESLEDTVYDMLTLNSPAAYSAESIKGKAISTARVLYRGAKVATSGAKFVAAKTIPVVKVASDKGWQIASKQYRNLSDTPDKLLEATNELLAKADELQRVKATQTKNKINYKLEGKSLSVVYNLPESANDIVLAITNIGNSIKAVNETWLPEVTKISKELVRITKDHDQSYPDKTLEKMNSALSKVSFSKVESSLKAKTYTDTRFKQHKVKAGEELPGNLKVFIITPDKINGDDPVTTAKNIRVNQIKTMRTTSKRYDTPSEGDMSTMALDEIERCLKANIDAIKHIKKYVDSGLLENLKGSSKTMQSNLDKIFFKQVLEPRWARVNNAIYMHTGLFMKWSTEPMSSLVAQALSAIRSNITICRRHLSVYKR